MPEKPKFIIIAFILLIVLSLAFAGSGFYLLQKEKVRSANLQEQLDSLKTKLSAAEARLEEYKKTISTLDAKLKDAQTNIDTLTATIDQETKAKQEALDQVRQLRADLEQQKQLRSDLETKLQQVQKDTDSVQAQLKDLNAQREKLQAKIKDLEAQAQQAQAAQSKGVELGTIVVGSDTAGKVPAKPADKPSAKQSKQQKSAPALEGKVLVVNKDYSFVVINLGNKDGVAVGNVFALYHGNKYLGDIKVEKVHDSMSAADFGSPSMKDAVAEGDKVVFKAK
ncbi:MAG: hypothetical protein PHW54_01775 [Candidatus Omnitrophica bacterium]|nr:hypothetical protein [Candidatus Omnitrophota bacterium]